MTRKEERASVALHSQFEHSFIIIIGIVVICELCCLVGLRIWCGGHS